MDIVEFSKSQRNKPIAIRLGYIYNLHRSSIEKQDWRCKEYFKKKCPATIQTKVTFCLNQNTSTTIPATLMKRALTWPIQE